MTKDEAAAFLYDESLRRNGGEHNEEIRQDILKRLTSGDSQTIRAVCLAVSPEGEESSDEVVEAAKVLIDG